MKVSESILDQAQAKLADPLLFAAGEALDAIGDRENPPVSRRRGESDLNYRYRIADRREIMGTIANVRVFSPDEAREAGKETMTQRALRKMMTPRPNPLEAELKEAVACIEEQAITIIRQRAHIKALDARIAKLEAEADGLTSLL